jgi:hypothetical protein
VSLRVVLGSGLGLIRSLVLILKVASSVFRIVCVADGEGTI